MKRCPKCNRTYTTDTQKFCTHDGGILEAVQSPQGDTIRIDSSALDAPTKAISRELVSDSGKFDPYKTTIGQPLPPKEETTEGRGRITQDLAPVTPLPPPDSGTLPALPPPPPPPAHASQPASSPLPPPPQTPSPQVPTAAQAPAVRPVAAPSLKKKSKLPLVLGILAVLFILGAGGVVAAYFVVVRPILAKRLAATPVESPQPPISESTPRVETSPTNTESRNALPVEEPPPYNPPSDAVQFVNSSKSLDGKLAEHYVDFNFYYPERWEKDPKAGVPGASNFVKVERRLPPDFTQENFAVGWYSSSGSEEGDRATFPTLVENMSAQFAKGFPEYHKVSEGETKAGPYRGYEFRFESTSRNTAKGDLKIWGRAIFLPPPDGSKNGVTLVLITTSLAPELKSVEDVGAKGELPMILESFRFGKQNRER
jgi:hypothetical protein